MNYEEINKLAKEFEKRAILEKRAVGPLVGVAIQTAIVTAVSIAANYISSKWPAFKNVKDGINKAISLVSNSEIKEGKDKLSSFIKNGNKMLQLLDTISSTNNVQNDKYILALESFSSAATGFMNDITLVDAIMSKNQKWYQQAVSMVEENGLTLGINFSDLGTIRKIFAQLIPQLTLIQSEVDAAYNKFKQALPEAQRQSQESVPVEENTHPTNNISSNKSVGSEANAIFEELSNITF
jgi:hypothetical protein